MSSICHPFGQIGRRKSGERRRTDYKFGDLQYSLPWFLFLRLKHKKILVTCFFFFLRFFLLVDILKPSSPHPHPFAFFRTHTHTSNAFIHTPRRSLATELPLQWDHCVQSEAIQSKTWKILQNLFFYYFNWRANSLWNTQLKMVEGMLCTCEDLFCFGAQKFNMLVHNE